MDETQMPHNFTVRQKDNLEYVYRDFFSVFVSPEEVLLEFGNVERAKPDEIKLGNRIVISVSNAIKLQELLQRTLGDMRERMHTAQMGGYRPN